MVENLDRITDSAMGVRLNPQRQVEDRRAFPCSLNAGSALSQTLIAFGDIESRKELSISRIDYTALRLALLTPSAENRLGFQMLNLKTVIELYWDIRDSVHNPNQRNHPLLLFASQVQKLPRNYWNFRHTARKTPFRKKKNPFK